MAQKEIKNKKITKENEKKLQKEINKYKWRQKKKATKGGEKKGNIEKKFISFATNIKFSLVSNKS